MRLEEVLVSEQHNTQDQPGYEEWLRIIGRHLDVNGYDTLVLFETRGGFVVRASGENGRDPDALEFPKAEFGSLKEEAVSARGEGERHHTRSRILPTGYEDFLRALGSRLDRRMADAIVICELVGSFAIAGLEPQEDDVAGLSRTTFVPFEHYLQSDDVHVLLDEAFGKRDRRGILNRIRPGRSR